MLTTRSQKKKKKDLVEFVVNAPYDQLRSYLERALVGLHTMRDEHFGISVVEFMAAGLCVLAHGTGGPLMDIVVDYEQHATGCKKKLIKKKLK